MKNIKKNVIVVSSTILLLFAGYVYRSYRYVQMVSSGQYMLFYEAVNDYYDRYGVYPEHLSQIDSLIPYKVKRTKELYSRVSLHTKGNTSYFYFSTKLSFNKQGKLSWPFIKGIADLELFSIKIPRKPNRRFRIVCDSCNKEKLEENIKEALNDIVTRFKQNNSTKGNYIEYIIGDVTFTYSNEADFYFYTSNYRIDGLKEKYIIELKDNLAPLLVQNKIKSINIPIQLPEQTPIPPISE